MEVSFIDQASRDTAVGLMQFFTRTKDLYSPISKAVIKKVRVMDFIDLLFLVDELTPDLRPYFKALDSAIYSEGPNKQEKEIVESLSIIWAEEFEEKAKVNLVDLIEAIKFYKPEEED